MRSTRSYTAGVAQAHSRIVSCFVSQTVLLDRAVDPESPANKGNVERWLLELETMQWASVRTQVTLALQEYPGIPREQWVLNWPAQAVLGVSQASPIELTVDRKLNGT